MTKLFLMIKLLVGVFKSSWAVAMGIHYDIQTEPDGGTSPTFRWADGKVGDLQRGEETVIICEDYVLPGFEYLVEDNPDFIQGSDGIYRMTAEARNRPSDAWTFTVSDE